MKKAKTGVLVAICAASAVMMIYMCITPILSAIQRSFPEAGTSQIQMVYTTVSLVAVVSMLLGGNLTSVISKKNLTAIGMLLMMLGGLLPLVLNSQLWMLYFSSVLIGFGMGIVNVLSSALISDHFKGIEKGTVMGYQSAALSLGGAICSTISGKLAEVASWSVSYAAFIIILPLFIVFYKCMPADKLEAKAAGGGAVYSKRIIWWAVLNFIWTIFMTAFNTNISLFIEEANLGSTTLAGAVSSMFMLIGIPAGFILGWFMKKLGRNAIGIACMLHPIGMTMVAFASNVPMVFIGSFLFGVGFAIRNPGCITFTAYMVPAASAAAAIAFVNAIGSLAGFISPVVVNWMAGFFGGTFRATFQVCAVALFIVSLLYLFANPVKQSELEEA